MIALLLAIGDQRIWYLVPLLVVVSLVYAATRHEYLLPILGHAIRFTFKRALELDLMNCPASKSDDNKRNTYTLVRALVWYAAKYRTDVLRPVANEDGLMIEQHFVVPMGMKTAVPWPFRSVREGSMMTGPTPYTDPEPEDYYLCGSLDEICQDEDGDQFVLERKSTTTTVADYYFLQHEPSVQIYTYDLIGSIILPTSPLRGVVVEACQTAVGFTRFERHEVTRIPEQRKHWLETIHYWVKQAEQCALSGYWPMNPAGHTFESTARQIQRRAPSSWPALLKTDFMEQPLWNPLRSAEDKKND
ncbi:hypothetical protein LCGC14_2567000 [marine sediment metagenome]|uniref:Uncharacterized protein n=1 Tax=marine sediment metagenome TaxID=412755 RepID=A0A0F9DB98_9ZZZZ